MKDLEEKIHWQDPRRKNSGRHVYIIGKDSGGPIVNRKILLTGRLHIPCDISKSLTLLSLSLAVVTAFILLYTLERTTRIVGFPGSPRVTIRGHRRLQPASKSGSSPSHSLCLAILVFLSPREEREREIEI